MKLFNMDVHISVIADFKHLFPEFEITDWCMSGHSWVFRRPKHQPAHINANTWTYLTPEMIVAFQREYDTFLRTFDGFICGHPNVFAMVFEKYGKPIIMINSCRYDLPFCWSKNLAMLESYKACLRRLQQKGLLVAVSNNMADQLYTKLGCGIVTTHIPSLCAYTGVHYNPTRTTFLCYHGSFPEHPLITHKSTLGRFEWPVLGEFRGIIHIPYEVSTMSMFEHYIAGIPLFFPSKKYMSDTIHLQSVSAYWKTLPSDLAFFSEKSAWIDLADFYEVFKSPNVYLFDSFEHLVSLLESFEWKDDSAIRKSHEEMIRQSWNQVLKGLTPP